MKNKVPIIIEDDPNLEYEKNNCSDIFKSPIMGVLALWVALKKKILGSKLEINTLWFDGLSPICRTMKENAMRWKALDIAYNHEFKQGDSITTMVTDFWLKIKNAKSVRNRLKLIKKKLREQIENILDSESRIRLLSIASGSAQGVIEVMAEFKQKGISIKAILLDLDPTAIEYSSEMARKAGIIDQLTFINKSVAVLEREVGDFRPNIIEMVVFLDYRPKEKATRLIEEIYRLLTSNGVALISNIAPNFEYCFISQVLNWPMIYRFPEELAELIIKGGFNPENCKIIYEPLRIHGIAICRK
jgi:SAM-dependent methyltransferase